MYIKTARLSYKVPGHGSARERLKSSLGKFYGRYGDIIRQFEVSFSQMLHEILGHDRIQCHPLLIRHISLTRDLVNELDILPTLTLFRIPGGFH